MRKLLAANFNRLWKDRIFWCVLSVVGILSLVNILNSVSSYSAMVEMGYVRTLDDYYFNQAPLMGAFFGLFVSMFLGTEYSDGVIRNKLVIGHKREHIYLGHFIVCEVASFIILAVWLLVGALGFVLIGPMEMGISGYILHVAVAVGITASFVAVYTLVGSLSSNKAMTVVYSIVCFIVLAIVASGFYDRLSEPEFNEGMALINNELVMMEPAPNPLYLSGTIRLICQCAMEFFPSGQALLLSDVSMENPLRAMILGVVFTMMVLSLGCILFRKKDIK